MDPYNAFFSLVRYNMIQTVQCVKLNSPAFMKIAPIDVSYLYWSLLEDRIPYNRWESKIVEEL